MANRAEKWRKQRIKTHWMKENKAQDNQGFDLFCPLHFKETRTSWKRTTALEKNTKFTLRKKSWKQISSCFWQTVLKLRLGPWMHVWRKGPGHVQICENWHVQNIETVRTLQIRQDLKQNPPPGVLSFFLVEWPGYRNPTFLRFAPRTQNRKEAPSCPKAYLGVSPPLHYVPTGAMPLRKSFLTNSCSVDHVFVLTASKHHNKQWFLRKMFVPLFQISCPRVLLRIYLVPFFLSLMQKVGF